MKTWVMRTILLSVFLTIIATHATAQSQTQPFAPAGAKWWYNFTMGGNMNTPAYDYYTMEAEKDTIVNGNLCTKLITPLGYEFMCRDSHRVYIYSGTKWYTLLDFTLQPGDTMHFDNDTIRSISGLPLIGLNDLELRQVVDSIKIVNMAGRQQRVLYASIINDFNTPFGIELAYEIIGGEGGVFGWDPMIDLGWSRNYFLRCYEDSIGSYILPPFDVKGCDWQQRVGTEIRDVSTMSVSPNPASGPLLVTLPENLTTAATLVLYNPLGQQVQRTPTVPGQAQRFLSVHGLPAGMYILTLEGPAGVLARAKVVKE